MDLLGPSLEDLLVKVERFSLKTVLMLMDQIIDRVEFLHNKNFLHRDIKPANFCMGLGENTSKIFMIDFGYAKRFFKKDAHIPYREGKNVHGNLSYISINTHLLFLLFSSQG